jgi:hypothetical protein
MALDSPANAQPDKPTTDFAFADGRTRHITYDDGKVTQVKDSGNQAHNNHLNNIGEWHRLGNGKYMGVISLNSQASSFIEMDKVEVERDGSIRLSRVLDDQTQLGAVLKPDGTDTVIAIDKDQNYRKELEAAPDGTVNLITDYKNGSRLNLSAKRNEDGVDEPDSLRLASNGGYEVGGQRSGRPYFQWFHDQTRIRRTQ